MRMATSLLRWLHPRLKDQLESCPPPNPPITCLGRRGIGSVDPIADVCLGGVSRLGARTGGASSSIAHAHARDQAHAHVHARTCYPSTNWNQLTVCCLQEIDPTPSTPLQSARPGASVAWLAPADEASGAAVWRCPWPGLTEPESTLPIAS